MEREWKWQAKGTAEEASQDVLARPMTQTSAARGGVGRVSGRVMI